MFFIILGRSIPFYFNIVWIINNNKWLYLEQEFKVIIYNKICIQRALTASTHWP